MQYPANFDGLLNNFLVHRLRQPSDLETISTKEKLGQLTFHGHAYQNQIKTRKFQSCLFHIAFKDQTRIFLMQMAHDRYFLLSALAMYSLCLEITDVVLVQITKL
jgi:hypothetical protein